MENLSEHFSWAEFCEDSTTAKEKGINNECANPEYIENAKALCENVLEKVRAHFGVPLTISSFYRCPALNEAVGGVYDSQHQYGMAADIEMGAEMNWEIMKFIRDNLDYDEILNEYPDANGDPSWVHVSFSRVHNRHLSCEIK